MAHRHFFLTQISRRGLLDETIIHIDILIEILTGLIISAIIGAASSMFILYRCIHKQAIDMKLMKKATAFVLRRQVQETKHLHPESIEEIEDLEKTYKDLTNGNSK